VDEGRDTGSEDAGMMRAFGPAGAGVGDTKATVDSDSDGASGSDWRTSAGDGFRAAESSAWGAGAGGDCIAGMASCWVAGGRLVGVGANPSRNRRKALSSGSARGSSGAGGGRGS
jgi:hypothetical protein